MKPNMHVHLVHWQTGEVLEDHYFVDSSLSWQRDKLGRWFIYHEHTGEPTNEWLTNNPRPR